MGKKRKKSQKMDSDFETKLFWFLATAYIVRAIGRLDAAKEEKLDQLSREHGGDWKGEVETSLGIDGTFVRSV